MTGKSVAPLSNGLYVLTWLCLLAMPVALLYVIVTANYDLSWAAPQDLVPLQKHLAALVATGNVAVICVLLWRLQRLFQLFRSGAALSEEAAVMIRKVGATTLALAAVDVLAGAAMSAILTFPVLEGQTGTLAVSVTQSEIGLFLFGGLLMAIGHIYAAAVAENRAFV